MKKKSTILVSVGAFALVGWACVIAYDPVCEKISDTFCPNGATQFSATCTSSSTRYLNIDVGNDPGFYTQATTNVCIYSCVYTNQGNPVNCGSRTNIYAGDLVPNSTQCPTSGSGSGSGGGDS